MSKWPSFVAGCLCLVSCVTFDRISALRVYDEKRMEVLRQEVVEMFYHGYDNYIRHAYPFDELRPLSCHGHDTWGSYSLTLVDSLDTLAVLGNFTEFRRVAQLIVDNASFDMNINVSVFETNIRILGGLLSAHLLSAKAGMPLEKGYPCTGPLLRLAEKVARKLLPAFDTPTGMPYGTINLRNGVPLGETPVTCTAGVGTFIVEFGTLSRLTGDPLYERVALRALHSLFSKRSALDLVGNHIDTTTGKWTAVDSGIGAGVDSYFEYLVKGSILLNRPELMQMFKVSFKAIEKHLAKGGWYVWATMAQGHVSSTTFQSLESFWPGLLSLVGEFRIGLRAITNYHRVLKQYGGLPEMYNFVQGKATNAREGYPLRPELVESAMYLYRATKDPYLLEIGEDMLHSLRQAKTDCGYASIRDVTTLTQEDRMESFFLSETTKYLYLLFSPDNFIHNEDDFEVVDHPIKGQCTIGIDYVFNTEAHPVPIDALHCCTGVTDDELHEEVARIDEVRRSIKFKGRQRKQVNKKTSNAFVSSAPPAPTPPAAIEDENQPIFETDASRSASEESGCQRKFNLVDGFDEMENPLLNYASKKDQVCDALPPAESLDHLPAGTIIRASNAVLERLLKKLVHEQEQQKKLGSAGTPVAPATDPSKPGLNFVSPEETKSLEKLIQTYETKPKPIQTVQQQQQQQQQSTKPKPVFKSDNTESNRIRTSQKSIVDTKSHPDFDLIFSAQTTRSLSFYFALKRLREFPDVLLKQIFPSEKFDYQAFYMKMSDQFSSEKFAQQFNFTLNWLQDFGVLKCQNIGIPERFMFFRPSLDD